jgi:CCR4-NOT transcription complex subunit 1
VAQNEARELQGAGIYNAMGFYVTLVAIFEQAESDLAGDEIADAAAAAGRLMDRGIDLAPELVLLGLERENERFNELPPRAHKARDDLWKSYLRGSEQVKSETLVFHSETLVYHQLYNSNPQRFIDRLLEFYLRKETPIDRVVHIGSELGVSCAMSGGSRLTDIQILDKLLGHENTHLALDVAAVGAEREMLDLEMWLADGVEVKGDDFLQNIFDFVETRIRHEFERRSNPDPKPKVSEEATVYPLSPAVYSIFIRVIRNAENLSAEDVSRFKHLRTDILILHPSLLNFYPGSKEEQGFSEKKPAKDITVEVEAFFEAMYTGQTTLDACIQELKKKQASEDEVDREVFSWCLHSLFDEYKFITNYPPKELAMTSVLFGGIIDARLVKDIPAFVATRYVLDACKANVGEPTHNFGVYALGALRNSLVDFPGLCRSLLDIPVLHDSQPGLINDITAALLERQELDEQGGVKLAFSALKLPVLVEEGYDEFVEPEPKKKDQIMFIINQIAPSNYEQKSRDLQELFEDQYSRWFAHYFVEVRVALEVNRHDIYQNIVDTLNSPVLDKHILWETYRKARDLINNEDTLKLAPLRAQLKTVALWLGRITLARNKPIRFRELSLKDLLLQAQDNGRLIVAIPFVCQLLSRCSESVVFHLPNPWLHSLLALLAEFYLGPGLKIGLKFDIQLLFGGLGLVVDEFTPSNILQTRVPASQPHGDTPDRLETEYRRALSELLSGNRFTGLSEASQRMQSLQDGDSQGETAEWFLHRIDESIARLPESMVFGDYSFWQAPGAKRAVHAAVSVAIRDMLAPVVERSVTIAGISTRDLLAKDFSTEADPAKMRHAAQLMVKNLAGNLTLVTCREPLRERMTSNIKAALVSIGLPESASIDPVVESIVNDNLEAASIVLKDLTVDKASKDIDVNLAAHFLARQTHAESRSNQPFIDSASMGINIPPGSLPQMLRMIPGGLMPGQARVYEAFAQEQSKVYGNGEAIMYRENEHERSGYPQEIDSHSMAHSPRPRPMTIQDAMQNFQELAVAVDRLIAATHARAMSELPANHDLRAHISSVVPLISQVGPNDQASTALSIAQKVVQLLYRCNLNLGREAYVFMLQTLCEYAPVVDREVKEWLIYADDAVSSDRSVYETRLTISENSTCPSRSL